MAELDQDDERTPGWDAVLARLIALELEPDRAFTARWIGAGPDAEVVGPWDTAEALVAALADRGIAIEDMSLAFVRPETGWDWGGFGGFGRDRPLDSPGSGDVGAFVPVPLPTR